MTIKLSDWAGVKSIRSLSYTSGILQASQLDTLLAADIPHNLNALPDSLELWVEQGGGQWEQHDPSAYVLADDTNLVNTGTTLASVLGATTLVRLTASSGPVAISVGLADSGQAGLIAGLGNQTLSPALSLENTLSILPTTNQLVLGTTNTTTISATAPASSAVYTIPDVGTTADFVLTAGAQTIGGAKTFTTASTTSNFIPANTGEFLIGNPTGTAGRIALSLRSETAQPARIYSFIPNTDSAETNPALNFIAASTDGSSFSSITTERTRLFGFFNGNTSLTFVNADGTWNFLYNVGIGTSSPSSLSARAPVLHLKSSSSTLPGLVFESGHSTYLGTFEIQIAASGANSTSFNLASSTANPLLTVTQAGVVTLGPASGFAGVLTHTFNGAIKIKGNIPSAAYEANTLLIDNNVGTTRLFAVGPDTSTRGTLEFRLTSSNNSLPALAGSIATTTAWVIGGTGNTALHNLNTAALTTSTAAGISYLRIQINGITRRIPTYNDA